MYVRKTSSSSPMHFKRVPRRIRRYRFDLLILEKKLTLDFNKLFCARGCMSMIGKDKLRALRHYYFHSLVMSNTYLTTHAQMVFDVSSDISISFEYYIFIAQQCCRVAFKISLCVINMRLHRV